MQQRRPRLGDILDDYCPRERRITNHAVVAMIEDDVKQTRCTTCEAEHEYKQARMPTLRRKKDAVSTAYKEVLAAVTGDATMQAAQAAAAEARAPEPQNGAAPARPAAAPAAQPVAAPAQSPPADVVEHQDEHESEAAGNGSEEPADAAGRVHRRLIRATLPRPENQPAQRPVPQFTMRQPQGRPGKFRAGGARGPSAGRTGAQGRPGGHGNSTSRGPGFARNAGGRAQGPRNDFHRSPRGGAQARHGKKHSK
jgi:hypothetical protein